MRARKRWERAPQGAVEKWRACVGHLSSAVRFQNRKSSHMSEFTYGYRIVESSTDTCAADHKRPFTSAVPKGQPCGAFWPNFYATLGSSLRILPTYISYPFYQRNTEHSRHTEKPKAGLSNARAKRCPHTVVCTRSRRLARGPGPWVSSRSDDLFLYNYRESER